MFKKLLITLVVAIVTMFAMTTYAKSESTEDLPDNEQDEQTASKANDDFCSNLAKQIDHLKNSQFAVFVQIQDNPDANSCQQLATYYGDLCTSQKQAEKIKAIQCDNEDMSGIIKSHDSNDCNSAANECTTPPNETNPHTPTWTGKDTSPDVPKSFLDVLKNIWK